MSKEYTDACGSVFDIERRERLSKIKLNTQQQKAVEETDGSVLLLAVPGSGKTTVLTARLGYMIHRRNISPESILVLTFTVAAANEMKRRFSELYATPDGGVPEFRTINGISNKIINDFSYRTGRTPFELVTDEHRTSSMLASIYREITSEYATESVISEIKSLITRTKNGMLGENEILSLGTEELPFAEIYARYQTWLRTSRLMDFDDQLVYALAILKKYPDILRLYTSKYRYICVDEAQDTSKIQHAIIKLLTGENGNVFMVGDEDQSIYGFRGAEPDFLLDFERTYPNARVLKSEENFRSAAAITEAADKFVGRNSLRTEKHMFSSRSDIGRIVEYKCLDIPAQYRYIAKLLSKNTVQTAVLYRNNECALPLIDILLRNNIEFSCRDTDCSFFSSRTFLDVCDILTLAADPTDTDAFMRLYYKLGLFLPKNTALRVCEDARDTGTGVFETLFASRVLGSQAVKRCERIIAALEKMRKASPADAVFLAAHLPGYSMYENGTDRFKTELLISLARNENTITDVLKRMEELREIMLRGIKSDGNIVLSTIHSAKGLEFDRVILINVVDGVLPCSVPEAPVSEKELQEYEEERRLFYVAATRAKNELGIFTYSSKKYDCSFSDEFLEKRRTLPIKRESEKKTPLLDELFTKRRTVKNAFSGKTSCDSVSLGSSIIHKAFGEGRITAKNGDVITAEFKNGKIKRFSLSCLIGHSLASFDPPDED